MKKRAREHVNQVALDWDENESDEAAKTSKGAYSFFFFFLLQAFRSFISNGVPWTASYAGYSAQQASQERLRREGDKFERNLKKIGNRNLTCKTNRIPETKKNSYIYNVMWLFLILHHKTLFFSLAFPMCKRGFSSMKLLIVQTGRLEM